MKLKSFLLLNSFMSRTQKLFPYNDFLHFFSISSNKVSKSSNIKHVCRHMQQEQPNKTVPDQWCIYSQSEPFFLSIQNDMTGDQN